MSGTGSSLLHLQRLSSVLQAESTIGPAQLGMKFSTRAVDADKAIAMEHAHWASLGSEHLTVS